MKRERRTSGSGTHDGRGIKTTIELPVEVWRAAKIRAMDDYTDLRSVVIAALSAYLRVSAKGAKRA